LLLLFIQQWTETYFFKKCCMKKTEGIAVFLRTCISCFFIFCAQALYAAGPTSVGGTYSSNQTWTPEGSPYIVTSDITVTNCATLTITTSKPGGGEAPVVVINRLKIILT
jgi:hypothetical protein